MSIHIKLAQIDITSSYCCESDHQPTKRLKSTTPNPEQSRKSNGSPKRRPRRRIHPSHDGPKKPSIHLRGQRSRANRSTQTDAGLTGALSLPPEKPLLPAGKGLTSPSDSSSTNPSNINQQQHMNNISNQQRQSTEAAATISN